MTILVKHHWHALLDWIGRPEALQDPALDEFIARLMKMDSIVPEIEGFFRNQKKVDVAREAQARGIPATPLLTPAEVLSNEHSVARGTFRRLEVADGLEAEVPSGFFTIDGERAALGDPAWAQRAEIDRGLEEWTGGRGPREVMDTLQAHGVPAGIVAHAAHHFDDPHLGARGYRRPVEQPGIGRVVMEGPAFRGGDLPEPIVEPAPLLGEHTREIASRLLGLSDAEIADLIDAGVLEDPPDSPPAEVAAEGLVPGR